MPSRRVVAALVVMAAAWGASASASASQLAGVGTGSVVGVVSDAAGLRVPGVGVTISGLALMTPRQMTTRADGEYRFAALPPGDYVLTFVSPGFAGLERHTHVSLGVTLTIDVTLTVAPQREEIAVYGALDRHSAAVSQSFDARQLASLPGSRSMGGLFALTHALALPVAEVGGGTGIISGGAYGAYGRNNSPRHTIEGIVVTGLFGAGFTPDYGALEHVSVLTAAHGAEWPTAGIHTDFATKSGSNQYRGTFYGAAAHRRLQSSNVDADQIRRGAVANDGLRADQVNQLWHNADVNADIGGFVRRDRLWWYSSARLQEVAARLVNFPVEPYVTRLTNYSSKATVRVSPRHTLVFYGQRGLNHQPTRLDSFAPGLSAGTAINRTRDSTVDQRNAAWLWKGEWNANVRDSIVFELRGGQFGWEQDWTPRSTAPRFEDRDTLEVEGGNRDWQQTARRNQLTGTVGYFAQNRTGRHSLRFGGEALRFLAQETWFSGYPGNVLHVRQDGRPSSVYLFDTPSSSQAGVWTWSAYASDAWRPNNRLTLTLGLRYDRYRLFLPAQEHPAGSPNARQFAAVSSLAVWTALTPRLAAVFDMEGDGKTLVKFSLGRYRVAPNAALGFNSNPNSSQWYKQYAWADLNLNGAWDAGEQARPTPQTERGGDAIESLDPGLTLPLLDEVGAWIERSLPGGVALRTGAIWRLERFPYARQSDARPFEAFTVPVSIRDRGPDGLAGTADDGPSWTAYDVHPDYLEQPVVNEVRNVAGASSEYFTLEIAATRHTRGRWTLGAGFTHTWNGDHASGYSGQALRNNAYPLTPNDLLNAGAGGRYEFTTWTAKAHGTFEAPWQLRITPVLRHQSGQPFGRTQTTGPGELHRAVTLLMEPIGTRRMDHVTLLDVRIDRAMRVKRRRVSAFLDVFNCLNANPEQNAIWSSGASFLRPLSIVPPRIARIGLNVNW